MSSLNELKAPSFTYAPVNTMAEATAPYRKAAAIELSKYLVQHTTRERKASELSSYIHTYIRTKAKIYT